MRSLVRYALSHGGSDVQVILPKEIIGSRYSATNPTCVVFGENLLFNSRLVNYRKVLQNDEMSFIGVNRNQTCLLHNYGFNSRNVMFGLYGENISWASETNYPVGDQSLFYKGLEDCRLVVWDGVLYAYGTRWDVGAGDTARICLYQLVSYSFDIGTPHMTHFLTVGTYAIFFPPFTRSYHYITSRLFLTFSLCNDKDIKNRNRYNGYDIFRISCRREVFSRSRSFSRRSRSRLDVSSSPSIRKSYS